MSLNFEELDYRLTAIGWLILRRRRELSLGVDIFEIKLGDEFLMSSNPEHANRWSELGPAGIIEH